MSKKESLKNAKVVEQKDIESVGVEVIEREEDINTPVTNKEYTFSSKKSKLLKDISRRVVLNTKGIYEKRGEYFNYSSLSKECKLSQGNLSQFFSKYSNINDLPNMGLNIISGIAVGLNVDIAELLAPTTEVGESIKINYYDNINNLHLDILKLPNDKESVALTSILITRENSAYEDKLNIKNAIFLRNSLTTNEIPVNGLVLVVSGPAQEFVLPDIQGLLTGSSTKDELKSSYNNIDFIESGKYYIVKNSDGYCVLEKILKPKLDEITLNYDNNKTTYKKDDLGSKITIIGKVISITSSI